MVVDIFGGRPRTIEADFDQWRHTADVRHDGDYRRRPDRDARAEFAVAEQGRDGRGDGLVQGDGRRRAARVPADITGSSQAACVLDRHQRPVGRDPPGDEREPYRARAARALQTPSRPGPARTPTVAAAVALRRAVPRLRAARPIRPTGPSQLHVLARGHLLRDRRPQVLTGCPANGLQSLA